MIKTYIQRYVKKFYQFNSRKLRGSSFILENLNKGQYFVSFYCKPLCQKTRHS